MHVTEHVTFAKIPAQ